MILTRSQSFTRINSNNWLLTNNPTVSRYQKEAKRNPKANLEEYVRQWVLSELIKSY